MRRSVVTLLAGLICGIIAVYLTYSYVQLSLQSGAAPSAPAIEMGTVAVANKDLSFGALIDRLSLKLLDWPKASIPKDAFTSIDQIFENVTQPGDRVALVPIHADEPITRTKISGFGERPILSRQVANDMRAVSIRVDDVVGVSGFVLPGDRVDVMLTRRPNANTPTLVTDMILQNITVLGIDQVADQAADRPIVARTATVEVTPEQAQKLALAQQAGTLGLVLRSFENSDLATTKPITERDLVAPLPAAAAPTVVVTPSVRVRYGDGTTVDKPIRP
jgi:pilus assembly protein CpaB